jgi:hypothetical protein
MFSIVLRSLYGILLRCFRNDLFWDLSDYFDAPPFIVLSFLVHFCQLGIFSFHPGHFPVFTVEFPAHRYRPYLVTSLVDLFSTSRD